MKRRTQKRVKRNRRKRNMCTYRGGTSTRRTYQTTDGHRKNLDEHTANMEAIKRRADSTRTMSDAQKQVAALANFKPSQSGAGKRTRKRSRTRKKKRKTQRC